jgi:hypothetical protein
MAILKPIKKNFSKMTTQTTGTSIAVCLFTKPPGEKQHRNITGIAMAFMMFTCGETSSRPAVIGLMLETSPARLHAKKPNGDLILRHTQPDLLLVANLLVD